MQDGIEFWYQNDDNQLYQLSIDILNYRTYYLIIFERDPYTFLSLTLFLRDTNQR